MRSSRRREIVLALALLLVPAGLHAQTLADSLYREIVRSRAFIRAAETQLTKVEGMYLRLRADTVWLQPGRDLQPLVDSAGPGAVIRVTGTHKTQTIVPLDGQAFVGPGTLDGIGTARHAFTGAACDVVIRGLVIRGYANPAQTGAIAGNESCRWTVEGNTIVGNAGVGVRIGDGMVVRGNWIVENGQLGVGGIGDGVTVEGNEVAWNNHQQAFEWGWEAGGMKLVRTHGLTVRGNHVHHNHGPGIWTDIDNAGVLVEWNRVEDNVGPGIFHEIGYDALIRYNEVRRNGIGLQNSYSGAAGILISASGCMADAPVLVASDGRRVCVEVHGNLVADNGGGIAAIQQARGSGAYGEHRVTGLWVHDNEVRWTTGFVAVGRDDGRDEVWSEAADNRFDRNRYVTSGKRFHWAGQSLDFAGWQAAGQDRGGSFTAP